MHHFLLTRKFIGSSFLSLCVVFCYGQKLDIRSTIYGGLFFFRGSGATSTSTVRVADDIGYHNPTSYGRKSDFSYAIELQAQWVTKQKHVFGLGVGYEELTSKAPVDFFYGDLPDGIPASGKVTMAYTYLTMNPFIGHRFFISTVTLDALLGVDCAFNQNDPQEEAWLVAPFKAIYKRKKQFHPNDLRPRIQVNAYYSRIGVAVGYSLGTENLYYYNNANFKNKKAYANFLRLGVSYRLK